MSESYNKLISTLQTIFEMDKADLDFGIYRIMNQKRDEINRFLEQDLLPQVKQAFADYSNDGNQGAQAELDKLIQTLSDAGMDPEQSPKVVELRQQLASVVDVTALENDVFSKLHTFFSRYYDKGDFISQRRYKADTYAIPYEGEEVKLYWANHDQYYIKSSEHLRDYAFIAKDAQDNDKPVRIKLVEADTEKDNVKAKSGEERRFVIDEETPLSMEDGELLIHFNFIPVGKKKQTDLNKAAVETIFKQTSAEFADWLPMLKILAPTEKDAKRTILEKHLNDYTARNTFDYFIHKDLGGFLNRELDFYIKNEVMHLDDIDDASFELTQQQLRKIKILRSIAQKIIRMLAQIEDFQKKLWLKKKFVVETNYCITLDRVSESLYPEIAANEDQIDEWVSLFAIDEIEGGNGFTVDFLKKNNNLLVDTKFYNNDFKNRLLSSIVNLDDNCDGLLIHSENYQALKLLQGSYSGRIGCVYVDPPYNTGGDGFSYKDRYQQSSWLSMFSNRLDSLLPLMSEEATFFSSIDDNEITNMKKVLDYKFGSESFESQIIIQSNKRGQTYQSIAKTHEYLCSYHVGKNAEFFELPKVMPKNSLKDTVGFYELWELRNRNPKFGKHNRPNLYYPFYVEEGVVNEDGYANVSLEKTDRYSYEVFPKNSSGIDSCWRWGKDKVVNVLNLDSLTVLVAKQKRDGGWNIYEKSRKSSTKAKSIWSETEVINEQGTVEVGALGFTSFGFPKPTGLLKKVLSVGSRADSIILDYFSGSGTTGHAAITLNRMDGVKRQYILVEMGDYFNTVLKPRITKVVYSEDWKDGKPISRKGISHCYKYIRLESYEDSLNNLSIINNAQTQPLLESNKTLKEDYTLGYWLDVETADSPSLLNINQFEDPFNYKLNIGSGSVGATTPTNVDLVETFNYLIGLTVKTIDVIRGFKIVTGTNPKGETVLVVWRNLKEKDNAALEVFLDKQGYNPRDTEFENIYVNGDHTLEDPQSKVKMTEIEFKRLMFDVKDV